MRSFWNSLDPLIFELLGPSIISVICFTPFSLLLSAKISSILFFRLKMDSMLLDSLSTVLHCFLVWMSWWSSKWRRHFCAGQGFDGRQDQELRLWTLVFLVCGCSVFPSLLRVRCWMNLLRRLLDAFSRIFRIFYDGLLRKFSSMRGFSKLIEKVGLFCESTVPPFINSPSNPHSDYTVCIFFLLSLQRVGIAIFCPVFYQRMFLLRS